MFTKLVNHHSDMFFFTFFTANIHGTRKISCLFLYNYTV